MHVARSNRSFRSLLVGRLVTNAGDSLYSVAAMWLVWELSASPGVTAVAGFLTRLPTVLQLFAGPLVDRWPLGRVLVGTQVVQAVLVLAVPAAWAVDALTVGVVLTVMPLLALCNQLVYPAQAAAVPRLVEKAKLVEANSALALAYQSSDLVFNAVAGLLVAAVGAVALYLVDSVTFVVAALLFLSVRIPPAEAEGAESAGDDTAAEPTTAPVADGGVDAEESFLRSYLADLREGLGYVRGTVIVHLLAGGVIANFALAATMPILPAFGDGMGGATAYGGLLAAIAAGSLVGSLLANRLSGQPYGRLAAVGFGAGGLCWLAAVAVPGTLATLLLLGLAAVPIGVTNVVAAAMIQSLVPEALLGRVSSVATSMTVAMTPVGALAGGVVAETVGLTAAVALGGLGLLFIAVYTLSIPRLRRLPPAGELETLAR
ncbi:MFS transporter [Halolamina litorea]|uniref:MFS transporter n=1 Tax=Halolamina litorea TaxID=1515593 RepID=A0ABD6BWT2_9EURY|nr:MFS transporter [Halolamina litorea]